MLPHATAYNRDGAPAAMARIARTRGRGRGGGLFDLAAALGAKQSLAEIGLRKSDLDRAADLAGQSPYPNPTPLTRESIRALLDNAFHGRRPVAERWAPSPAHLAVLNYGHPGSPFLCPLRGTHPTPG